LSKQLENHMKQLSKIGSIVEQLPRYLKNADIQSKIIKKINSSMNQLQIDMSDSKECTNEFISRNELIFYIYYKYDLQPFYSFVCSCNYNE
jgi:hypothetical protein